MDNSFNATCCPAGVSSPGATSRVGMPGSCRGLTFGLRSRLAGAITLFSTLEKSKRTRSDRTVRTGSDRTVPLRTSTGSLGPKDKNGPPVFHRTGPDPDRTFPMYLHFTSESTECFVYPEMYEFTTLQKNLH